MEFTQEKFNSYDLEISQEDIYVKLGTKNGSITVKFPANPERAFGDQVQSAIDEAKIALAKLNSEIQSGGI